jgi:hypothetical protein
MRADACIKWNFLGGFAHHSVVGADQAGFDGGLRLGAAFEQAALDQQPIGAEAVAGQALSQLHRFGGDVLAERLERLGRDAFGVEAGGRVHSGGRILIDENVGQHHAAHL